MLSGDYLFNLERQLDAMSSSAPEQIAQFCAVLRNLYASPSYQAWLDTSSSRAERYRLDDDFGRDVPFEMKRLLDTTGLVNGDWLEVKIDDHMGRIHITDGPWVPGSVRVYPYSDESALICNYVREKGYHKSFDLLVDPAAGCGHHGLALSDIPVRAYYDVNPRAAIFCRINSILAGAERMQSGLNDLRDGLPALLSLVKADAALVTVNMPFAIFPKNGQLSRTLAQDGGDRGAMLTFAAIDAVKRWANNAPHVASIRLVLLFYSLGNGREWEVVEHSKRVFDRPVEHMIFTDETMWRVNGVKQEKNPMPLTRMATKAQDRHTYLESEQPAAEAGYHELCAHFQAHGLDQLGYGLIDVLVKG